jgi:NADH-quinone oxidoreductase subunit N
VNDTYIAILPILISFIAAFSIIIFDLFLKKPLNIIKGFSLFFAILTIIPAILFNKITAIGFNGQIIFDNLSYLFVFLISFISLTIIILGFSYNKERGVVFNEYYALLFLAQAGLIGFVSSYNILVLFLSLEIFSFSSYILTGIAKDRISSEAVFKYFYLGIVSSSFGLLGLSFLYGGSGTLDLRIILQNGNMNNLIIGGLLLFLINLFFKFSLSPFHIWTPDVYEGTITPIAGYFSVAPKLAIILVMIRIISLKQFNVIPFKDIIWIISAITILWGNIAALKQKNLKRVMAYSTIAHSGYISMGFMLNYEFAKKYLLFYGIIYIFLNLIVFAFLNHLIKDGKDTVALDDISGLSSKKPLETFILSLSLLSLAGFPPTIGFFAKFYLFIGLIKSGFIFITLIAVLGTLISVFYYFRIIMYMYIKEGDKDYIFNMGGRLVLFICGIIIIITSFYPQLIFNFIKGI